MEHDDDEEPEGYRTPAGLGADEAMVRPEDFDLLEEDPPIVRLTNALLLGAIDPEGTLVRVEPDHGEDPIMHRRPGARWTVEMNPPRQLVGPVRRRFKIMADLPVQVAKEPAMGFIKLRLGARREVDFCVFLRPCSGGERVIARHVPEASRRLLFGGFHAPMETLGDLRWKAEHAFRLARGNNPKSAIEPLRELHRQAVSYGLGTGTLQMESASALGSILADLGDLEGAVEAYVDARRAADRTRGGGPAAATLMIPAAQTLAKLGRIDEAVALGVEAVQVARDTVVEDPLIADLESNVGDILRDAGRPEAAASRYEAAIQHLTELSGPDDRGIVELRNKLRS